MSDDDGVVVSASPPPPQPLTVDLDLIRQKLRQRWELASVLNFLHVFEPVMQTNLKLSAEEIETALIEPNDMLAKLHIALLKGLLPASKMLNGSDAWVTALAKKLKTWWPWVAQGDFPLTSAKGEELSRYKELDPTIRLFILKSLCEVRADQDDIGSYINDAIKGGTGVSTFQKEKLGEDENGTIYWYDGNEITGHRLYREVHLFELKPKVKGRETVPEIYSQWEAVATNLEEFRRVVDEFSSSEVKLEVAVSKALEADAIPTLEKLQKKKQRALRQQQKQEMILNGFQNSRLVRPSRNCRPINYRYDEYDRDIKEAIKVTQKRKAIEEQKREMRQTISNDGVQQVTDSRDFESTESDTEIDRYLIGDVVDDSSDDEYDGEKEDVGDEDKEINYVNEEANKISKRKHSNLKEQNGWSIYIPKGSRYSRRLAGIACHGVPENININSQNRPRQRPSPNTGVECTVVPDSEDENSSEDSGKRIKS